MSRHFIAIQLFAMLVCLFCASLAPAQSGANSDGTYLALRSLTLGPESVAIANYDLKRDAGTFRLRAGTVCFLAPVNNKITGAVFVGDQGGN